MGFISSFRLLASLLLYILRVYMFLYIPTSIRQTSLDEVTCNFLNVRSLDILRQSELASRPHMVQTSRDGPC